MKTDIKKFKDYIDFRNFMQSYRYTYPEYMDDYVRYEFSEDFVPKELIKGKMRYFFEDIIAKIVDENEDI
ncbi:MAG: hypothetical protein AMQ22_00616 [Candidatus Methanofastidiosum methylothiophilum]|uniref:Uncharacterized protein n=1 Tax=Candidatus Methanofastidiosum methylothiophilum TaxID=1705564 RepID=A0A150J6S8_9EURY|nr:MAG: hypothetical protein AMQ22_00616 [Candidatus Methanofastidiosum methylthiophilus]